METEFTRKHKVVALLTVLALVIGSAFDLYYFF